MKLSQLQARLDEALKRLGIAGAAVAVVRGRDFNAASAGVLNVNTGVAITNDTVMHIGSIAKLFTATLIMQLVDEGRLDLDEPVSRYLPELRLQDADALKRISTKMLLNHTSGINGDVQPDRGHDDETIEKAVGSLADLAQIHDPAADCSYCNGGFVIAGYLAQRLSGQSWYQLIRERIYKPLGMQHAVTLPEEALLHRASVGHHRDARTGQQVRTSFSLLPLGFAPGGTTLMMSATDLVTFARAHLADGIAPNGHRLLSKESARAMRHQTSSRARAGGPPGFGLGWIVFGSGILGHGGGAPGVVSWLYIHPEKDFAAAVLTNSDNGGALIDELMRPWFQELVGGVSPYGDESESLEPATETVDPRHYVGTYENVLSRYEVTEHLGGLGIAMCFKFPLYDTSKTEPTPVAPLKATGPSEFLFQPSATHSGALLGAATAVRVAFKNPDAQGRMQHLSLPAGRPEGRIYRRFSQ